jgi:hypothetical protein
VKTRIARAGHRPPAIRPPIHEDYVIEEIDRLEAEDERREAMLFENDGGRERGFQTV